MELSAHYSCEICALVESGVHAPVHSEEGQEQHMSYRGRENHQPRITQNAQLQTSVQKYIIIHHNTQRNSNNRTNLTKDQ